MKCPAGCSKWHDGCNDCNCVAPGKCGGITVMGCQKYGEAKCKAVRVTVAKCKSDQGQTKWTSIISNYTAVEAAGTDGTQIWVHGNGSTAFVNVMIKQDGKALPAGSPVMGHLHSGPCTADASTVGPHWQYMGDAKKEVHFMFNTTGTMGMGHSRTCPSYPVLKTAQSLVLHEYGDYAIQKKGAKMLCCELVWTNEDVLLPSSPLTGDKTATAATTAAAPVAALAVASLAALLW